MRVTSTEVQNNFGKYLKFAVANEEIIVTRNGKDVVRILPCSARDSTIIREEAEAYRTDNPWVTYEEFLDLVEHSEQRYELIDGVIYNLASPTFWHQKAISQLLTTFSNWFKGKACLPLTSPFDVTFSKSADNTCVVQPDLLVICDRDQVDEQGKYKGVPTLVVEVLSPATRGKDMFKKLTLYEECGVQEYWIIDPIHEKIYVYVFTNEEEFDIRTYDNRANAQQTVRSAYFEGLTVQLADIFDD